MGKLSSPRILQVEAPSFIPLGPGNWLPTKLYHLYTGLGVERVKTQAFLNMLRAKNAKLHDLCVYNLRKTYYIL